MSDILTAVYDVHGAAPFWALAAMLICGVWMPQNHQPVVTVRQWVGFTVVVLATFYLIVRLAEVRMIHPALFDDVRQWCATLEARL
jgi:hypothetical protein